MSIDNKFDLSFDSLQWNTDEKKESHSDDIAGGMNAFSSSDSVFGSSDSSFGNSDSVFGSSSSGFGSSDSGFGSSSSGFGSSDSGFGSSSSDFGSSSSGFGSPDSVFGSSSSGFGSSDSVFGSSSSGFGSSDSVFGSSSSGFGSPDSVFGSSSSDFGSSSSGLSSSSSGFGSSDGMGGLLSSGAPSSLSALSKDASNSASGKSFDWGSSGISKAFGSSDKSFDWGSSHKSFDWGGTKSEASQETSQDLSFSSDNQVLNSECSSQNDDVGLEQLCMTQEGQRIEEITENITSDLSSSDEEFNDWFEENSSDDIVQNLSVSLPSLKPVQYDDNDESIQISTEGKNIESSNVSVSGKTASRSNHDNIQKYAADDLKKTIQSVIALMGKYGNLDVIEELIKYTKLVRVATFGIVACVIVTIIAFFTSKLMLTIGFIGFVLAIFAHSIVSSKRNLIYKEKVVQSVITTLFNGKNFDWGSSVNDFMNFIQLIDVYWDSISNKDSFCGNYRGYPFRFHDFELTKKEGKNTVTIFRGQVYILPLKEKLPCHLYITERSFSFGTVQRGKLFRSGHDEFDNRFRLELVAKNKVQSEQLSNLLSAFNEILDHHHLDAFLQLDDIAMSDTRMVFSDDQLFIVHSNHLNFFECPDLCFETTMLPDLIQCPLQECNVIRNILNVIINQSGDLLYKNEEQ